MIARPARCSRHNRKAERAKIQRFDERLYDPRRIVRIDVIFQRGWQKRSLSAVMALDKAVHETLLDGSLTLP